ncbi:11984_t:CDS:2 [Ambispora leptoticha]|uniref:11984_t:CDS:1 n=1 Tax=Ambispora leptoticha TaxID=144679 RepID=A0A9N9BLJ1_9GLOM|nr:11984_t:CDS:2 [Ambispora leptoticha]
MEEKYSVYLSTYMLPRLASTFAAHPFEKMEKNDLHGNGLKNIPESADILWIEGFLPPFTKGKNPIHILQYMDKVKLSNFDECCPSISPEMHRRLCCTICGKDFPTLKIITDHKKTTHPRQRDIQETSSTQPMFMPPPTPISPIRRQDNVQKMVSIQSATIPPIATDTEFFAALDQLLGRQDLVTNSAFVEDFTFLFPPMLNLRALMLSM